VVGNRFVLDADLGYQQTFCHQNYDRPASCTEILDTIEYVTRVGASVNVLVPHIAAQPAQLQLHYRHHSGSATGITQPNYYNSVAGVTLSAGVVDNVSIAVAQTNANNWTLITRPFNWQATGPNSGNITTLGGSTTVRSQSVTPAEIGPVWYTSVNTRGITFHSIAAGGRRAQDFLIDRPDCAPMLRVLAPDIVVIAYGANDSEQNFTAQQFGDAMRAKIRWWQQNVSTNLVFVLLSDPDRSITSNRAQWDLYPEQLHRIAEDATFNSVHVNRRRILEETNNWLFSFGPAFNSALSDGVHYAIDGARRAALQTWMGILDVSEFTSASLTEPTRLVYGPSLTTSVGPLVDDSAPIRPRIVRSGRTHRLRVQQTEADASQFQVFGRVRDVVFPVDIVRSGIINTTITVPSASEYFIRRITESASPTQNAAIWLIHQEPT
jgi:lysophospholipase L1-like esterase